MGGALAALGIRRGDVVSVAGAGGKTTLVYRLAAECRAAGWRVLVTTTTHMGTLPEAVTGPLLVEAEGDPWPRLRDALAGPGMATLVGRRVREDKLEGIAPERVDALALAADVVLVEADGARGRSLKAPAENEPVVASSTTALVVVAGLDVLGEPLDDRGVHRLERVLAATGRDAGSRVDEELVAAVLAWPGGYPSRVPAGARAVAFLNKAESPEAAAAAARIAERLRGAYDVVAAGSARSGDVRRLA